MDLRPFARILQAVAPTQPGPAVGLGSLLIPGTRAWVQQIIDFAQSGNRIETPLGVASLESLSVVPGRPPSSLRATGLLDGQPWSLGLEIPEQLIPLASGEALTLGPIEIRGSLCLPRIQAFPEGVTLTFATPFEVRKAADPDDFRLTRRMKQFLSTQLRGFVFGRTSGRPLLGHFANWIAPELIWGD